MTEKVFIKGMPLETIRKSLINNEKKPNYQRCSKCVMDSSINNLNFDDDGICEYCKNVKFSEPIYSKKKIFEKKIYQIKKNQKSKYQAILGLSGGVDSSFLAVKCKEWNINVLLVHFDNGWNTDEAVRNIKAVEEYTKFDLYTHVVKWEEFKKVQLSFLKSGLANFEAPSDHGIFALLFNTANSMNIPFILTGVNKETETFIDFKDKQKTFAFGYSYGDLLHLKSVYKKFYSERLTSLPLLSYSRRIYLEFFKKIKKIDLLNFLNFKKEEAINYLERETNWKRYPSKHFESIVTRFHQSFILPVKFGLDKRTLHLSNLIWSNQLSRDQALIQLEQNICDPKTLIQDYYFFLKKMDLSEEQFKEICLSKNKNFDQFNNTYKIYKLSKKILFS